MGRNFFGRVEICFPVLDGALKQRVIDEGLMAYLDDKAPAWCMDEHGQYHLSAAGKGKHASAQQTLLEHLAK